MMLLGGESTGSSFLLRACIFLLLLILSLLQLAFFTLLPEIQLHAQFCNVSSVAGNSPLRAAPSLTSAELARPMHFFYQSLYLSPEDIKLNAELRHQRLAEAEALEAKTTAALHKEEKNGGLGGIGGGFVMKKTPKIRGDKAATAVGADAMTKGGTLAAQGQEGEVVEAEMALARDFFLQSVGQGHEPVTSSASYCINVIAPTDSADVAADFELYLDALPSSRPIRASPERTVVPHSVIDLYLERHPTDRKYYPDLHAPRDKKIWMLQNAQFFDRHELTNPTVGVLVVKNRIGLKKVLEYRQRHQLSYSVLYAKHTSADVFDPSIERDWNSFLHLAGWSPFKHTHVIVEAWAKHPEWPKLVLRAIKPDLCLWIERAVGMREKPNHHAPRSSPRATAAMWPLANVDYKCGAETVENRKLLQNQIGLHLSPSEIEGFGHYINEARSAGALVLTSNVAPMNELVDSSSGVLVGRARPWWWQTKGDLFMPLADVSVADLEQGVEQILLTSIDDRKRMGRRARARYLEDRAYFLNAMSALEASLCQDEIHIDRLEPFLY